MKPSVPLLMKLVGGAALVALVVLGASRAAGRDNVAVAGAVPAAVAAAAPAGPDLTTAPGDPGQVAKILLVNNAKPIPAFSVTTFDGRVITPASLKGKVAVINFWATWCGPCRAEIPFFIALQQKYGDQLVILGLSEDETGEAGVRQFVAANRMTYAVGMTTPAIDTAFGGARGIPNLPMSFVIDREGKVVQRHVGLYGPEVYENEIRVLLSLPVNGVVEKFDDDGHVSFENAAEAKAIPGIDLNALTAQQRKTVLQRLNAELCTCGCKNTVAQCRIDDPTCETSLPLAKKIVADIVKTVK